MRKFKADIFSYIPWVEHGFYTRDGAPDDLVTIHQTHSNKVCLVDAPWAAGAEKPEADALVTEKAGLALGIRTADCVPVLFAAKSKPIVAAAHAGWRGALDGVLEETLRKMQSTAGITAEDIVVAIGPCIGVLSYEVTVDFAAPMIAQDIDNQKFFHLAEKEGHLMFDLSGYCEARLKAAGVTQIEILPYDTMTQESDFFSHRRGTLRGEVDNGRQMSAISIKI